MTDDEAKQTITEWVNQDFRCFYDYFDTLEPIGGECVFKWWNPWTWF